MYYNKKSKKHELTLLGHMCTMRIEENKLSDLFRYLADNNIKNTLNATRIEKYFFVSMYFETKDLALNTYQLLLKWNP